MGILEKLSANRTPILLAEIGAYLHLLGKLSEEFIQAQSLQGGSFGYRQLCNNNPLQLDSKFYNLLTDNWVKNIFDLLNNIIPGIPPSNYSPENLCMFSKYHLKRHIGQFGNYGILKILAAGHDISGAEEKDLPWQQSDPKEKIKQRDKNNTFRASPFGFEGKPILSECDLTSVRNSLINELYQYLDTIKNRYSTLDEEWWIDNYFEIVKLFKNAYSSTVGDTQRPVNDVTLWDAAYLAASLLKSALVKMIIEGWSEPIDTSQKRTIINWKILRINVNSLALMSKGIKIGDILAYRESIEKAFEACKTILEIKYCLGNEIYRDNTGIYFSFPDVDTNKFWEELKNELKEAIQNIEPEISPVIELSDSIPDLSNLTSQREISRLDIVYEFNTNNFSLSKIENLLGNSLNKSEVCPICRLRPMEENSDGCNHCLKRRTKRALKWINDPQNFTIWLDEVSDKNDRVALLVGSFYLSDWLNGKLVATLAKKTASSGRVRRIWNTTKEFINQTIFEKILKNYSWGSDPRRMRIKFKLEPNPHIPKGSTCDTDLGFSPVCEDEENGIFISTINLEILEKFGKNAEEIAKKLNGMSIKIKTEEDKNWREAKIIEAQLAEVKYQNYYPFIKIYDFPDQFMVLVPAFDVLDIAKKIFEEYEIQFSKVRDRLPLHLGIKAFHRRTPLYVAMDAGKRFLDFVMKKTTTKEAEIKSISDYSDDKFGKFAKKLELSVTSDYSSVPLTWYISYSTGDPAQQDNWHPYIRIKGGNPNRDPYSFDYTGEGNYVVHVKELQKGDIVFIEPSYFKITFLDSSAERFKIDENLRPLDDIKRMIKLWDNIKDIVSRKKIGSSRLYAYWQEVEKRRNYDNSTWEEFVKASITNILEISRKEEDLFNEILQATKDGLLSLCLFWNLQVRKIKPEKGG